MNAASGPKVWFGTATVSRGWRSDLCECAHRLRRKRTITVGADGTAIWNGHHQQLVYQHRGTARIQTRKMPCRPAGKIWQSREAKPGEGQNRLNCLREHQLCSFSASEIAATLCLGPMQWSAACLLMIGHSRWRRDRRCVWSVTSAEGMAAGRARKTWRNPIRPSFSCQAWTSPPLSGWMIPRIKARIPDD